MKETVEEKESEMRNRVGSLAALSVVVGSFAGAARGSLIWNGDAALGTKVFKVTNIETPDKVFTTNPSANGSSITAVTDPAGGKMWDFDKAAGDLRAEMHGAAGFNPAIGGDYYLGWRSEVTYNGTVNADFQWKAYGSPLEQNFPLVLKTVNGSLQLHYYPPTGGDITLWSKALAVNTWYSQVLHIFVSDDATKGYVEYYYNGQLQTLTGGVTRYTGRTFDGTSVDPKWGVYGATNTHAMQYVDDLKIGTTYADVAPAAVPEAGGLGLFGVGCVGLVRRRR